MAQAAAQSLLLICLTYQLYLIQTTTASFSLAWASMAAHILGLTLTYLGVHSGHLMVPHQLSTRVSRVWCLCSLTFTKPCWSQSSMRNSFISTLTSKWEEPSSPLRHGCRTRTSNLDKTELLLFLANQFIHLKIDIKIGTLSLASSKAVWNLGLVIDDHLTCFDHAASVSLSCCSASFNTEKHWAIPNPACHPAAGASPADLLHWLLRCPSNGCTLMLILATCSYPTEYQMDLPPLTCLLSSTVHEHCLATPSVQAHQSKLINALFPNSGTMFRGDSLPSKSSWRRSSSESTCSLNSTYLSLQYILTSTLLSCLYPYSLLLHSSALLVGSCICLR